MDDSGFAVWFKLSFEGFGLLALHLESSVLLAAKACAIVYLLIALLFFVVYGVEWVPKLGLGSIDASNWAPFAAVLVEYD